MLAGMCRSFLTRSTALMASPSETPGARLKDSVTTGNCPWCVIAIGTATVCVLLKALSGITLPLGNACVDAGAAPEKGLEPAEYKDPDDAVAAATSAELAGPLGAVLVVPPATTPVPPEVDTPERMNRLPRFAGSCWNSGFTSNTT